MLFIRRELKAKQFELLLNTEKDQTHSLSLLDMNYCVVS